ncbi:MAG: S-layer homology domain-containing protein [Candidatus Peregrinibacteria bacterium]|nr:S-layer homology domain-containing protein [Candidatus Peregrinibacteria bacterium]
MKRLLFLIFLVFVWIVIFGVGCAFSGETSVLESSEVGASAEDLEFIIPDLILVGEGGPSEKLFTQAAETYRQSHGGEVHEVTSGDEFIWAMRDFYERYGAISHLEYFGHGNEIGLYVDQTPGVNGGVYANDPVLNEDYLAASIYELPADIFVEEGWIQFNGCNVAEGYPQVNSLAQSFANYFGVDVIAPTGPTEFIEEGNGVVYMIPTYEDEDFALVDPQVVGSSGFVDVPLGQTYEEAVTALAQRGLDLGFEENRFLPYQLITYGEAVEFCRVAMGEASGCSMSGYEDGERLRNLRALQLLLDAYGAETADSDPWYDGYLWWANNRNLLTEDFTDKKWYTRGEMAELTWNLIQPEGL